MNPPSAPLASSSTALSVVNAPVLADDGSESRNECFCEAALGFSAMFRRLTRARISAMTRHPFDTGDGQFYCPARVKLDCKQISDMNDDGVRHVLSDPELRVPQKLAEDMQLSSKEKG
ncbi:hypothetical protein CERZMDRAFT_97517 [Cercospora zeae-maydis SCOH1-5]|uniref:Uncharacterized protein n=1 Tax=Cercospora zeae-maydis SCOH1-5 TaxID=717836 RepID=A0A6A6FFM9_9PEZI|nr:hypothetical protein CERZMDRAFT_97517 [Cercospora zeae-maydis SCOH1-5]